MTQLKKLQTRWHGPTPVKYRKLGKAIALLGTTIQITVAGMQIGGDIMTNKQYFFFVIGLAVAQWLGQTITDFATEDETINTIQNGQI